MQKKLNQYTPKKENEVQVHALLKGVPASQYKEIQGSHGLKGSGELIRMLLKFFFDNQPKN